MRGIKFRGKKDNDRYSCLDSHYRPYSDFIYGDLLNIGDGQFKIKHQGDNRDKGVYVTPETVGQYTGLKDINGKEIYEGDIVKHKQYVYFSQLTHYTGEVHIGIHAGVMVGYDSIGKDVEVIGNIYDNPEMQPPHGQTLKRWK